MNGHEGSNDRERDQPEVQRRPKVARTNLFLSALLGVQKERTKRNPSVKESDTRAELPQNFETHSSNRLIFCSDETEPSFRKERNRFPHLDSQTIITIVNNNDQVVHNGESTQFLNSNNERKENVLPRMESQTSDLRTNCRKLSNCEIQTNCQSDQRHKEFISNRSISHNSNEASSETSRQNVRKCSHRETQKYYVPKKPGSPEDLNISCQSSSNPFTTKDQNPLSRNVEPLGGCDDSDRHEKSYQQNNFGFRKRNFQTTNHDRNYSVNKNGDWKNKSHDEANNTSFIKRDQSLRKNHYSSTSDGYRLNRSRSHESVVDFSDSDVHEKDSRQNSFGRSAPFNKRNFRTPPDQNYCHNKNGELRKRGQDEMNSNGQNCSTSTDELKEHSFLANDYQFKRRINFKSNNDDRSWNCRRDNLNSNSSLKNRQDSEALKSNTDDKRWNCKRDMLNRSYSCNSGSYLKNSQDKEGGYSNREGDNWDNEDGNPNRKSGNWEKYAYGQDNEGGNPNEKSDNWEKYAHGQDNEDGNLNEKSDNWEKYAYGQNNDNAHSNGKDDNLESNAHGQDNEGGYSNIKSDNWEIYAYGQNNENARSNGKGDNWESNAHGQDNKGGYSNTKSDNSEKYAHEQDNKGGYSNIKSDNWKRNAYRYDNEGGYSNRKSDNWDKHAQIKNNSQCNNNDTPYISGRKSDKGCSVYGTQRNEKTDASNLKVKMDVNRGTWEVGRVSHVNLDKKGTPSNAPTSRIWDEYESPVTKGVSTPEHTRDSLHDSFDKALDFKVKLDLKQGTREVDCVSHVSLHKGAAPRNGVLDCDDVVTTAERMKETLNADSFESTESTKSTVTFNVEFENCSGGIFTLNPDEPIPIPPPVYPAALASEEDEEEFDASSTSEEEEAASSYKEGSSSDESDRELEPDQIQAVTEYLKEIESKRSATLSVANRIVSDVNKFLRYWAKENTVVLYGSYLSGLAISTSNVNLALKSSQRPTNSFLQLFQKELSKGLLTYEVVPFEEETLVKDSKICFYEPSEILCEIMYSGRTVTDHIKTCHLLKKICDYDPRIKTLIIAARVWAEVSLMHETENGQLHPISFAFLMLHFLQKIEPPVLPIIDVSSEDLGLKPLPAKNSLEIGQLWIYFLKYYSRTFSWTKDVVTIHSKDKVSKSTLNWNSWIAIQDPCSKKNVGESVATIENAEYIFACFNAYYDYFLAPCMDSDNSESGTRSSDMRWKYSFDSSSVNRPLPVFCEACEELEDDLCDKCKVNNPSTTSTLLQWPEIEEKSMKFIDKALLDVYNDVILSDSSIEGRKQFVKDLEAYIRKIFHDAELTLFGSSVNKFGFKRSDLDICMTFRNKSKKDIKEVMTLKRLVTHLRKNPKYDGIFGLYNATVPIVKFHYPQLKWNCDLSLYNVLPVHNSKLLSKYAMMDERCRILGCALKYLAMKGWIGDSSSKSLSSYSYVLMVIHYLQQTEPPVLPVLPLEDQEVFIEEKNIPAEVTTGKNYWFSEDAVALKKRYKIPVRNESSTAQLWIGFLEYYLKFDNEYAVTITQKEPMLSSELKRRARLINIEDPFICKRNLGCVVSEEKAGKTHRIFVRARSLFGCKVPEDKIENPKTHFFSTNNLTGQFGKEMECTSCGAFDHEKEKCFKANPFMNFPSYKRKTPLTRPRWSKK